MRRRTSGPNPAPRVAWYIARDAVAASSRGGRSARRRSARGSTTPRRARRCSRWAPRTSCAAATPRATSAPCAAQRRRPCDRAPPRTPGSRSAGKYSRGRPTRRPLRSREVRHGASGSAGRGADVASTRIAPADDAEHPAASDTVRPKHRDAVERRAERDQPVAAHPAVGRLDADDAAEARRLPHRAAGLGAEGRRDHAGRDERRRAAGGAARHAVGSSGFCTRPKAEFSVDEPIANSSQVRLAGHQGARGAQPLAPRWPRRASVALEDPRGAGGGQRRW